MLGKKGNSNTTERIDLMKELTRKRILWGHQVYIGALRLEDNSLLTIIAPHYAMP
jgi:hypothetical protein